MLRWSPSEFRQATIWEADQAYEAHLIWKGAKKPEGGGLTEEDIEEINSWME